MKLYLEALREFFKKYKDHFLEIWNIRDQLDSKDYQNHEAQFLPAALSLQETPPSPLPFVIMRTLIGFALIAFIWALLGKIDIVATAHGKIVPNDRTKMIQPFDTSTVKKIYVKDGQFVKAGEVLVELDATLSQADMTKLQNTLDIAKLEVERAKALSNTIDTKQPPQLTALPDVNNVLFKEAEKQLASQYQEFTTKLAQVDAEIDKNKAELASVKDQVHQYEQIIPIAEQREKSLRDLLNKHFVSKHDYLDKQQELIEQKSALAVNKNRVSELEASVLEAQTKREAFTAETNRQQLDIMNQGADRVKSAEEELVKATQQNKLMTLSSPVDGVVQQLAIHTVGGVVTEAQQLMVIVPQDEAVEVEAFVENKDIGFIHPNQEAEVKVETFQYTKYGTIPAKVTVVSHDAIEDEKRGLIYLVKAKLSKNVMLIDGQEIHLSPGMSVGVEIKTGKRRVIEYFLSPLIQYAHESLQER